MIAQMELIGNDKVGILKTDELRKSQIDLARRIADQKDEQLSDSSFMVVSIDKMIERFNLWKKELPMIEPFYAVKCNTDQVLIRVLASLGCGFDCASREEIDIVMSTGVTSDRVIYANPCKTRSFIAHALERDVRMMTFDNAEELKKISKLHPNAEMILRIAVSDPTATCPLNLKFGCDPVTTAPQLLKAAQDEGVKVVGISFHVGSGCNDATAYRTALEHAKNLCDIGEGYGFKMNIIDMGGGFPGYAHQNSFENIAQVIRSAIDEFFPDTNGKKRLIAEPGRFFAAAPFSLVANIIHATEVPASKITKKEEDNDKKGFMYYINDGVYGSFNCILFDHVHPVGYPLFERNTKDKFVSTIWGPTCDSLDLVEDLKMLEEMSVGDWMYYPDMGAYTSAAATTFNGFAKPTPIYVMTEASWEIIRSSKHI